MRPQGAQYLIYNSHSDELHLISPTASYLVELCDGLNTIGDVAEMFSHGLADSGETAKRLNDFYVQLLERGVLDLATS
jgi:hypothetical protein